MIRRRTAALAMLLVLTGCTTTPTPTPTKLPSPSAIASPTPTGAAVVLHGDGRFPCDWAVGCGVFVEFAAGLTLPLDSDAYQPRSGTDLRTVATQSDTEGTWIEVMDTHPGAPPVPPGGYAVVAGTYLVDDTQTPHPEDSFPVVSVPSPCATPLDIDEVTTTVEVVVHVEPDGSCVVTAFADPVDGSVPLTIKAAGGLDCFIYSGCMAVLSFLRLPDGAGAPPSWYDHPQVEFATVVDGFDRSVGDAIDPLTTIGPGQYLVIAGERSTSDLGSFDADGNVVFPSEGANTCQQPLVVDGTTTSVQVDIDFSEGAGCTLAVGVD